MSTAETTMKAFVEKYRDLLLDITGNLFILGLLLLLLHHFTYVIVSIWIDISLLTIITFASGFGYFLIYIQKDEEYFKTKTETYFRHLFLAGLLIVTTGSLTFDLIENNELLNSLVSFISSLQFYFVLATIGFGFITFYFNRERIETETQLEKEQEDQAERKRAEEFDSKFAFLRKFDLDYGISENWNRRDYAALAIRGLIAPFVWVMRLPYSSGKWMYREGLVYSAGLILIISLFACIRFISPLIYQTNVPDEFFHMASAKSLLETGEFAHIYQYGEYKRGALVSILNYITFSLFGISFYSAKLVPILLSIVNLAFIMKVVQKMNFNKKIFLLFMLSYTLNPITIFNHYTIRMYILYETFIILLVYLLLNINTFIKKSAFRKANYYIAGVLVLNYLNWFWMYDTGKYVLPLATFLGFLSIFVLNLNFSMYIFQNRSCFLAKFFSKLRNRMVVSGLILTMAILINISKIRSIANATHFPPTPFDFWNLFFEYWLLLTIFTTMSFIIILFKKNESVKIVAPVLFALISLHLYSSLEIHHWRTIAYLIPIYLIISFYGINELYTSIKSNSTHMPTIIYLFLVLLIVSSAYTSIVPKNYSETGPTIPEYNYFPFQTNMVATSEFVNNNFDDSYIIIESIRGYNLPSPKIYDIPINYKLDLKQSDKLDKNGLQTSMYIDNSGLIKPIYMNTTVITSEEMLTKIIKENKTVIILSEEAIRGNGLFEQEHLNYIISTHPNNINFTGIRIYWQ